MTASFEEDTQKIASIFQQPGWYQAMTLTERIQAHVEHHPLTEIAPTEYDRQRLERWREQPPFNREDYFAQRLELANLTEQDLLAILSETDVALQKSCQKPPAWLAELEYILTNPAYFQSSLSSLLAFEDKEHETRAPQTASFAEALTPFIARGAEHLRMGIQSLFDRYSTVPFEPDTIQRIMLASLPGLLLNQASRTLTLELHVARMSGRLQGKTTEERFQHYIDLLRDQENLQLFLQEYSPLARLLLIVSENWLRYSLEFLEHLCSDWEEIRRVMQPDTDPGMLVEVQSGVGDAHRGGKSTLRLRFASGFRLIYKPKSMAIDIHFQQLLDWLNQRGDHPAFRMIQVIDRGTYGWSEFIMPQDCNTAEEVARFYERQGGYLALFYALEATDVHFENLIAAGEHPIMIDLESLLHPRVEMPELASARTVAVETMDRSVLRVGLLPQRIWSNAEQTGIDVSGLTGKEGQLTPMPVLQIAAMGTDQMRYIRERVVMPGSDNLPRLNGQPANVLDYRDQLMAGFSKIYHVLMQHRDELLAGPLQAFAQDEIRVIVRATQTYAQLLLEGSHPDLLRNALDRDRFFDRLWVQASYRPQLKKLIAAEIVDLHNADIPMFTTRPNTRDVYSSQGVCIANCLTESSLASVTTRLLNFSRTDLERQSWFIEASLATIELSTGHMTFSGKSLPREASRHTSSEGTLATRLRQAACAVGDRLCDLALYSEHGANWIGLSYVSEREWMLAPCDADLYNGVSGITLFLAYLGSVTGIEKYTNCARAALTYVREMVKQMQGRMQMLGGYGGWGCILYLYSHLGFLWQDQELLAEAGQLVAQIPDLVDKDEVFDVIGGCAGAIAGLISLYQIEPTPEILRVARLCGERLLVAAPQCRIDRHEENTPNASKLLTGISHGAAGMALNLLRLAHATREERFRQGAIAAMQYERQVFSPTHQNWPDFREETTRKMDESADESLLYMLAWCHGAPGIGLARLASLPYYSDEQIHEEIEIAVRVTLAKGFGANHSLCHGDLGNLETILSAARTRILGSAYQAEVEKHAYTLLSDIERFGWLTGIPLGVESPGLMCGIAGIGYELLRLAAPEQVPSVLVLEAPALQI